MRTRSAFWRIVAACIGIRIVLQAVGLVSVAAHGKPVWQNVLKLWHHWDAHHYLRIAEVGYVTYSPAPNGDDPLYIVFFPFFPATVAMVAFVVRNVIASALIVSLLSSIGAAWLLFRLVALDSDEATAWRAVALLLSFPTAYYLSAPYSEALFLFAVLACMYAARTGRWARAGIAGALATGTRVTGIALAPALVAEALTGQATRIQRIRRLGWSSIASVGLLTYLVINHIVHGDALHFLDVQRSHWYQRAIPPWESIADGVRALLEGPNDPAETFIYWGRIVAFSFALLILALALKRARVPDSVYGWSGLLLILSASWLISLPRYLVVLYPIFIVGAQLTRSRRVFVPVVVTGATIQIALFWRYAVGEWTF